MSKIKKYCTAIVYPHAKFEQTTTYGLGDLERGSLYILLYCRSIIYFGQWRRGWEWSQIP